MSSLYLLVASYAVGEFAARASKHIFGSQSCEINNMLAPICEALDHLVRSAPYVVSDIKIEVFHHVLGIRGILDDLDSVQFMIAVWSHAFDGHFHVVYMALDVIPQAISAKVVFAFDLCTPSLPLFAMIARNQVLLNFFKLIRQKSNLIFFSLLVRLWSQSLFREIRFLLG